MKNKWIVVVVILICCLVYAIVKLSMLENQNMSENQDAYNQAEATQSAKQINTENTGKAIPEEGSDSDVPAVQVEAVTKVFSEFQSALKSEDYEQAWKLTSESLKSKGTFEEFKKDIADEKAAKMAIATIHPESAISIEGRVRLLVTTPKDKLYLFFIQENGQWKLHDGKPAENVDTSKE
jgi:hypothetical protein